MVGHLVAGARQVGSPRAPLGLHARCRLGVAPSNRAPPFFFFPCPPLLQGTAFTQTERDRLGLRGLLPPRTFTPEWQEKRLKEEYDSGVGTVDHHLVRDWRLAADGLMTDDWLLTDDWLMRRWGLCTRRV